MIVRLPHLSDLAYETACAIEELGKLGDKTQLALSTVMLADGLTNLAGKFAKGSLSNQQVRQWYNNKVKDINTNIEATEANAKMVVEQRNSLKREARDLMSDRKAAADLDITDPIHDFEYYNKKYDGDYSKIIKGSATPNVKVNEQFNVK